MKREKNISNQFSIQFVFIMLLFLIIVILSVMVINLGQGIYIDISSDRVKNYEIRVSLSYIANKIRQADKENSVDISTLFGNSAIVIKENYDGLDYENWIYYYDSYLYEILIDEGASFEPTDGTRVIKVESFSITKIRDNLYMFTEKDENGSSDLALSIHSYK